MLVGHKNQWNFLVKAAELDRLSHAYLFSGQEQLGKKTLAIEFVKFLNCQLNDFSKPRTAFHENDKAERITQKVVRGKRPCQVCRSCQDTQKDMHPDFILIRPASSRGEIQISQIRELIWKLSLRPYSAPFKTAIIDQAHLMTPEAQNCFLKILEEPKGKALLILMTEYPELLLSTILSRVQKIRFFPVKRTEIENYLINQGISQNKAEYFSSLSLGKPGMAINFFLDAQSLKEQEKLISDLTKISNSDFIFRFQYAKELSLKSPQAIKEVLYIWLQYFREILLKSMKDAVFSYYSLVQLKKILKLIQRTNFLISTTNINSRLALEILLSEI